MHLNLSTNGTSLSEIFEDLNKVVIPWLPLRRSVGLAWTVCTVPTSPVNPVNPGLCQLFSHNPPFVSRKLSAFYVGQIECSLGHIQDVNRAEDMFDAIYLPRCPSTVPVGKFL